MITNMRLFAVEQQGDALIVRATANLTELECCEIEIEANELLQQLATNPVRNLILDLGRTDYFGSSALGLLIHLKQAVQRRGGRMALCNVSEHEQEIMRVCHLETLCQVYPSVQEAVSAVNSLLR